MEVFMKKTQAGISLVELLLVLSVMTFLLIHFEITGFSQSREEKLIDSAMADIVNAIAMARLAAVTEAAMVTFCRSDDGQHCRGKWQQGSIIFTDSNGDRTMNGPDRLLYRLEPIKSRGQLTFRSFRNRKYLQMTPRGTTNYQNGNFTWCPANGDPLMIRQVVVSLTGRTRFAKDSDGDGVVENSQGKEVEC